MDGQSPELSGVAACNSGGLAGSAVTPTVKRLAELCNDFPTPAALQDWVLKNGDVCKVTPLPPIQRPSAPRPGAGGRAREGSSYACRCGESPWASEW